MKTEFVALELAVVVAVLEIKIEIISAVVRLSDIRAAQRRSIETGQMYAEEGDGVPHYRGHSNPP
ncbi:hypothetical protein [Actinoplanes flavus]|uniref:Uncharacterized protein n=1 Tax=Actinoplanes flavus TaxID=2820290 RepID=A0ABS3UH22_9ACTN|nr:hypothetical protein [Actinoplanes flavus]MBO3737491.1 hypothetical protein [Actinoplanes flavus]